MSLAERPFINLGAVVALATAIAIPSEGLLQYVYKDVTGLPTICFGHTGSDVHMGDFRSIQECHALLDSDMTKAINAVELCAPGMPDEMLAAFADAAMNLGSKIACDTNKSTAARKLKAHDWVGACSELTKWDKARVVGVEVTLPGLTKRRELERELCLKGAGKLPTKPTNQSPITNPLPSEKP